MATLQYEGVGITAMAAAVPHTVINNYEYTDYFPSEQVKEVVDKVGIYERRFGDTKCALTTQKQHFSYDFEMRAESDGACRIEFNLGAQGYTARVHIENVRLEKTGEVDYSAQVTQCLPDGNYITNGQFQEGKARLAGWEIENKAGAAVTVTKDRARACAFCGRAVKAGRQGWRKAHVGKGGEAHGNARPLQATCRYRWRHEHRQAADVSAPAACFFMRRAGDSPPAVCL